jgi:hypothetical protein
MKINTLLVLFIVSFLVWGCAGEGSGDSAKQQKPLVKTPPKTTAHKAVPRKADPNLGKKAKPGFTNKFERGQKRRETIRDKFDDHGNLIERTDKMFDEFGEVKKKNRYTYKYDDAGRRTEQWYIATTKNDDPIMSNVNYLKYNEKGWKVENIFISYGADGVETRWVKNEFKHNNDGRIIEDVTINKDGIRQLTVIYNIVNGELVSENFIKYDEKGEPLTKQTLTYDEFGTVTSSKEESLK